MSNVGSLSIIGNGFVKAEPDHVLISLTVECSGKEIDEVIDKHTELSSKLQSILLELGVEKERLHTTSYSHTPNYDHRSSSRIFIGYTTSQSFQVKVDIGKEGKIIRAAAQYATINQIAFAHSRELELKQQAIELAIIDAQTKAANRAELLGIRLGDVIRYSESANAPRHGGEESSRMYSMAAMNDSYESPDVSIASGTLKIHGTVNVDFLVY